jgi:prolyl-tRNA editing enzyme YbaK/EbsC (Cys-tRNA(Pro) deacylase)
MNDPIQKLDENLQEFEHDYSQVFEEKLKAFMDAKDIDGKYLNFEDSCHSVEDAARALGTTPDCIVKNICLVGDGRFIVVVLKGEDKVDRSRVKEILNLSKVKIASPDEILELSGYPCGGVPSFGFEAAFLIDTRVLEKDLVYSGGGSTTSLMEITPKEILRANKGIVADVRQGA